MTLQNLKQTPAWKIELWCLLFLSAIAFIAFRNSSLDLWMARLFFHPEESKNSWLEAQKPLWLFFYHAAPWITGILLLGSLGLLLLAQFREKFRKYRIYSIYIFLAVALGPGLVVNALFKPYWGRPRPREVIELGGHYQYRPFYAPAVGEPGKSFPCGHCSVGFTYAIFWLLLRRKNFALGSFALMGSIAFGILMGIGRIADGGHFFSDVVWAGLLTWFVDYWLYYYALKVPQRESIPYGPSLSVGAWQTSLLKSFEQKKTLAYSLYAILGFLTVAALLTASPFYKEIQFSSSQNNPETLRVQIDQGDVEIKLNPELTSAFILGGTAKGFGFPRNHVDLDCTTESSGDTCEISRHGFFSDYETNFKLEINPRLISSLDFHLKKGHVIAPQNLPPNYRVTTDHRR